MSERSRIIRLLDRGTDYLEESVRRGPQPAIDFFRDWTMREGRFKRMVMFTDVEQARRAAGPA